MAYRIFVRRFGRKTINIKYSILCASESPLFHVFMARTRGNDFRNDKNSSIGMHIMHPLHFLPSLQER